MLAIFMEERAERKLWRIQMSKEGSRRGRGRGMEVRGLFRHERAARRRPVPRPRQLRP